MRKRTTVTLAVVVGLGLLSVGMPGFVRAAPRNNPSVSVLASYGDQDMAGQPAGITDDGRDYEGIINGSLTDFSMTFGFNGKPVNPPRWLSFDLDHPVPTGVARGMVQAFKEVHAIVRGVLNVQVGAPIETIGAFKWLGSDGATYRIRYGETAGASKLLVTRVSPTEWSVSTRLYDAVGTLFRVTSTGEQPLGNYYLPVFIRLRQVP